MRSSVLVVEDDVQQASVLSRLLNGRGYDVRTAHDAKAALSSLASSYPAVIITDFTMPIVDGLELCRLVREASNVPVIVLSGKHDRDSEVAAFDAGADDYVTKPFCSERLLARVRAAIRRNLGPDAQAAIGVGDFHIDFNDRRVRVNGVAVRLTPKEFDLFAFMARNPNRVIPHKTLLGAVWGPASEDQSEYLRVFVGQLRKKLESDPSHPQYLVTEPWVGYRFNPVGPMPQ